MRPGSGPRHIALHPSGHLLYVVYALDDSISGFSYDAVAGKVMQQVVQTRARCAEGLAIHPTGNFLYTAGGGEVTAWRIDIATGALQSVQRRNTGTDKVRGMMVLPDRHELLTLTAQGILRMDVDAETGRIGKPIRVVGAAGARCIAIL
jgi:6-phosphogluconolactonase